MANPYELRYNIYQEAQQRLMEKFNNDHDMWFQFEDWQRGALLDGLKTGTFTNPVPERPAFPTHEQILVEAEKIYEFVQKKS